MNDRPTAERPAQRDRVARILDLIDRALADCQRPTTDPQPAVA